MDELERRQIAEQIKQLKGNLERHAFNFESGMDEFRFETTNESAVLNAIGLLRDYSRNLCEITGAILKQMTK